MIDISNKLKELRKDYNFTQEEIAAKLGISTSGYGFYEQGKNIPPIDKIVQIARIYNVSVDSITSCDYTEEEDKSYSKKIKVFGIVPTGIPIESLEDVQGYEHISVKEFDMDKTYIGFKISGDSMYPKYLEGDTVITEVTTDFNNNDDVICHVNDSNAILRTIKKK